MKKLLNFALSLGLIWGLSVPLLGQQNGGEKVSEEELAKRPEVINRIIEEGPLELLLTFVDTITDPADKIKVIVSLLGDQRVRGGTVEKWLKNELGLAWQKVMEFDFEQEKNFLDLLKKSPIFTEDTDLLGFQLLSRAYGPGSYLDSKNAEKRKKRYEDIAQLLDKGANPNVKIISVLGFMPLVNYAVSISDYELALMLLKAGAELTTTEKFDPYDFLKSDFVREHEDLGAEELIQRLLLIAKVVAEAKLDPNFKNSKGWTPLMLASSEGDVDMVKTFIGLGAKVDIATKDGWTPLSGALANEHTEVAKVLLDAGANPQFVSTTGEVALHHVGDAIEITRILVAQGGAQIDKLDRFHRTPLMFMAIEDAKDGAELLLAEGADALKRDIKQNNALHHAATTDSMAVARLLLEKTKIDINSKNIKGLTPLMMAAMKSSPEMVKLLLSKGADPTIQNNSGQTALDLAQQQNRKDIVELFKALETDIG